MKQKYIKASADYSEDITVYMNTWANYNEYGADGVLTPAGWMTVDEAREYAEKYADYEPFINDIDDYSGGVIGSDIDEYSNGEEALDTIETYNNLDEDDREVFAALIEYGYDTEEALRIVDDHDYSFYEGTSDSDIGYAVIDSYGSISELGDTAEKYFDYEGFGRDLRISGDLDYLFENDEGETDEDAVEEFTDSHTDREIGEWYVYDILGDVSELGQQTLENYFDYDAFGRDIRLEGTFIETDNGFIEIY